MTDDRPVAIRQSFAHAATQGSFMWLAISYAALFAAFGTESPFFPAFLATRGLGAHEISLVLAAGTLMRLSIGPVLGVAADRSGVRRLLTIVALLSAPVGAAYLVAESFAGVLLVASLHAACIAGLNPLLDTLALGAALREGGFRYGWVRGVGSGAFVLATLVSGFVVASFGLVSIVIVSSILFAVVAVPLLGVRDVRARRDATRESIRTGILDLVRRPAFRRVLLVSAMVIGSQTMSDTFAVIHWRAAGLSPPTIGALWAEAVGSEMLMFLLVGPWLLGRFGPSACAAASACAGVLQWGALASTTSPLLLCVSQPLHGFTFALTHLACMEVMGDVVPAHRLATAQTVYGTLSIGIASAVLTLVSGEVWTLFGAQAFWLMAVLCLGALPIALRLESLPHARACRSPH